MVAVITAGVRNSLDLYVVVLRFAGDVHVAMDNATSTIHYRSAWRAG